MARRDVTLSLVERGWQAARQQSLDLAADGVRVVHVTKGRLGRGVRTLIAPQPGVRVVDVPYRLFWPVAWGLALVLRLRRRLAGVLVDNERSLRRVTRWLQARGLDVRLVREAGDGDERRPAATEPDATGTPLR